MEIKNFVRLILKEDLNDVQEIIVETKKWFYHWTKGDIDIFQKEDSETHTLDDSNCDINYTTYIGY